MIARLALRPLLVLAACWFGAVAAGAQDVDSVLRALGDRGPDAPRRATTPCVVERVSDGDTMRCRGLGRVRLTGIDAPENTQDGARPARAALERWIAPGDTVQLEPDVEARDRYRRLLAYVWHRGVLLNWAMVRLGWAVPLSIPPNVQYADDFVRAVARARSDTLGLWRMDGFRCLPADRRRRVC
jgi:micrococcal nuclease